MGSKLNPQYVSNFADVKIFTDTNKTISIDSSWKDVMNFDSKFADVNISIKNVKDGIQLNYWDNLMQLECW